MGLELVGSRILAPYFGNSIFVWGSLITVFLMSLSIGYYIGGLLADKFPKEYILASILMSAGILILILPLIYPVLNQAIFKHDFGYKWNPLVASITLFLLPSVGMGMVSPYIIKLYAKKLDNIGNIAGSIYALSTTGSIIGTLGAAFFMIPTWGTRTNLKIMGGTLLISGFILLVKSIWPRN